MVVAKDLGIPLSPQNASFLVVFLENKVHCWENLIKRGFNGLGWCALCRNAGETTLHLFLSCPYYVEVWVECCKLLGLGPACRWEGDSIIHAWERWRHSETTKVMIVLPLLVTWGIWLARNNLVFNGKECTLEIMAGMVCGIALTLPKHLRVKN